MYGCLGNNKWWSGDQAVLVSKYLFYPSHVIAPQGNLDLSSQALLNQGYFL